MVGRLLLVVGYRSYVRFGAFNLRGYWLCRRWLEAGGGYVIASALLLEVALSSQEPKMVLDTTLSTTWYHQKINVK